MKIHSKDAIRITFSNGKTADFDSLEKAESIAEFARGLGLEAETEHVTVEVREIERGDRVHWLRSGRPNTARIDIVTDIEKDIFGDRRFLTKEIDGNRRGMAYESDLVLASV